jgi:hypothetical protein
MRMSIGVGHSPQARSFRSSDDLYSRSAAELLLTQKTESFLASRRFAQENPTHALMANSGSSFEVTVFAQLLSF